MERRPLGTSGLEVSVVGLGTMTWGEQNTEAEAHAQLDLAVDVGVNLVDTAEMYPVAPRAETQGLTETYLGTWLARPGNRAKVLVASKITGPAPAFAWIRDGRTRLTADEVVAACEGSLRRLRTDVIDLYQLHWPARRVPMFGLLEYVHDDREVATPVEETLAGLDRLLRAGKIRHVGLSNETPWGVMAFLRAADAGLGPRVVSVQNAYSLLNRVYEIGLAEIGMRERVGLLAYSPLAMGVLTGKYSGGARPPGSRLARFDRFTRYTSPLAAVRADAYVALAREHGLDPAQLALAFVNRQPFVASNLVGATTLDQLRTNLGSAPVVLSREVLAGIERIHREHPNPAP